MQLIQNGKNKRKVRGVIETTQNKLLDVRAKQRHCYQRALVTFSLRVRGFAPRHLKLWAASLEIETAMKLQKLTVFLSLTVLMVAYDSVLGQSNFNLKLNRRNPDGWFSLRVPKIMGKVERHADVDGGFYIADALEIDYDYWTYENTPNWFRRQYAKPLMLACSTKSKNTRTLRTKIDGKRAIIQRCSETDERKGC